MITKIVHFTNMVVIKKSYINNFEVSKVPPLVVSKLLEGIPENAVVT